MERWTWLVDLFRCEDNRLRRTGAYVSFTLAPLWKREKSGSKVYWTEKRTRTYLQERKCPQR